MKLLTWPTSLVLLFALAPIHAGEKPLLLQKPTISSTHIAFSFAGDLWLVPREGGDARRLTSDIGLEYNPIFSPDGSMIAFSGEYDGNIDVYLIPATGGEPRRLTYHPGIDVALGWTPDGQSVLFSSPRTSYSRFNKLFTFDIKHGGFPTELPLPMGEQGAFSPDGMHLAYVPFWNRRPTPNAYIAWKRYRGGKASPIWIASLADSLIEKVPREDSNDWCPMWLGGKVYFLSDRDDSSTLYSYDPKTRQVKKEIENHGNDIVHASAGPDLIVYEQFGSIHTFDPRTRQSNPVDVRVTADFPHLRPRYAKVDKSIRSASPSPAAARVAFEARGEIFTVPAEKGDIRNLTQTTGACERSPGWSPDGKTIAYFSDESGEYMLHLRDPKGTGEVKKIALGDAPNFYFNPVWAPDSAKIAYADNRQTFWMVDVATGQNTKIDSHTYFSGPIFDPAWSPDGRWLAYTRVLGNRLRAAFLYDTQAGQSHQVTDGMSDVRHLAFDRSGKYLYFTASTDIGPTTNGIDLSGMNRPVTRNIYLAVLDKTLPSPLAPESDEEKEQAQDGPPRDRSPIEDADEELDGSGDEKKDRPKIEQPKPTQIDIDGIDQRLLALPLPARNYTTLLPGKPGVIFFMEQPSGGIQSPDPGNDDGVTVSKYDLKTRKTNRMLDGVSSFWVSGNGEKLLYRQRDRWVIVPVGSGAPPASGAASSVGQDRSAGAIGSTSSNTLKLEEMDAYIDPRAEWRQMYRETWRLQRDFLYDPNYHGLDLQEAEKRYSGFLEGIAHRADLNYLFNDMLGNLVLGHVYIRGGETPEVKQVRGGLLGADYRIENGRYRFSRIYNGENWNPQLRAPLTQPGVNVLEGEYLLAVNGKELKAGDNLYKSFEATAGKQTVIEIGPHPDGAGAREVTVVPVESEAGLRNLAWIEGNRRKVAEMTNGRVAYVYLPDTALGGYNNFNRYFFAQVDKEGVVIDERYNGGGKAADYMIDYLRRDLLNYWAARDGKIYATPGGAIYGPKAMIINEFAGSGGDALPWYFRRSGCGPLVGKRTWGGLVGISGYPPLLDGGGVTAPSFAFFSPDGSWDVENRGVSPDVEIELDPYAVRQGRDPQLEKAVELVLKRLEEKPRPQPKKPAYPNYYKKTTLGDAGTEF